MYSNALKFSLHFIYPDLHLHLHLYIRIMTPALRWSILQFFYRLYVHCGDWFFNFKTSFITFFFKFCVCYPVFSFKFFLLKLKILNTVEYWTSKIFIHSHYLTLTSPGCDRDPESIFFLPESVHSYSNPPVVNSRRQIINFVFKQVSFNK